VSAGAVESDDEAAAPAPPPPTPLCDLCGYPMRESHCKLVCDQCGYTRDCSDP
jgi:hypothetical protein